MRLHTLFERYYDLCHDNQEPQILRLSPVMYGWFVDRMKELGPAKAPQHPPYQFLGATVVIDKEIDGYRFDMEA